MSRRVGVAMSYVLMIFEVLSTLLLTPFIIRTLGQAEYGVYKLSAAINAYLLLLDLGVGNAVTRYVSKYRAENNIDQSRKFLGVATIFYAIIAVITIISGLVLVIIFPVAFSKGLNQDEIQLGQKLLSITMINSAVTLGTEAHNNVVIAYEKFAVSKGASIVQIIIRTGLTYTALKMGLGSVGIVTVNLIMTVLCRLFFVLYVFTKIKLIPCFKKIEFGYVKEIVVYSSLILLQMIATQLNASVDQVLIGSLVASASVILAVYGIGTQITQYFQSIGYAFIGVLMPGIVRLVESKASVKELSDEMIRIGRIIFSVLVLILGGFIVNGRQFIILWAGKDNAEAYIVTLILMIAYTFIITESVGTQILWAMSAHKEQSFLKISIVLLNIVLTIFLIKWNPLIGATVGTFISLLLGDVLVMNVIFVKKIKMDLLNYYLELFKGIVPSIILSVIIGFVTSRFISGSWLSVFINILVIAVTYAILMFTLGMNNYEKNLCLSILRKIKKGSY